ncbi:WbqC family protein [Candidatus Woesearchaeota archaeon]|nr:WbqC family protein [Candidatus Woesearchaeota archaeon]
MTEKLVIAAHQPNFLPYIGFTDKMSRADVFLIRDDVQFVKRDFHHRNRIKIPGVTDDGTPNSKWLTIPVYESLDDIKDVRIKLDTKVKGKLYWYEDMLRDIHLFYDKAQYFNEFHPELEQLFRDPCESLRDYNMRFINYIKQVFKLGTEIVTSSEFINKHDIEMDKESECKGSINLASLCEAVAIEKNISNVVYLSGDGGKSYLVPDPFEKKGISIKFQEFNHPVYKQLHHPDFLPYMCSIDFILNMGTILPKPE